MTKADVRVTVGLHPALWEGVEPLLADAGVTLDDLVRKVLEEIEAEGYVPSRLCNPTDATREAMFEARRLSGKT